MKSNDDKNMDLLNAMMAIESPIESREEQSQRIRTQDFTERHKHTNSWLRKYKPIESIHELAVEEYIASRNSVLQLGLLKAGLSFAAQSVEKYLKCHLIAHGLSIGEVRKFNHNISEILSRLVADFGAKDLDQYRDFCTNLEKWYNSRYPDNKNKASRWSRNEIDKLDEFIFELEESMPMPEKVEHLKYGGGEMGSEWSSIFVRLFSATSSQSRNALLYENQLLISKLVELNSRFEASRRLAVMPATTLIESAEHSRRINDLVGLFRDDKDA